VRLRAIATIGPGEEVLASYGGCRQVRHSSRCASVRRTKAARGAPAES
jgi:hypothetical protein